MTESLLRVMNAISAPHAWEMYANIILRSALILLLVWAIATLWPRISAAQRHLALSVGCGAALLVPALYLLLPAWNVTVLPTAPMTQAVHLPPVGITDLSAGFISSEVLPVTLEHPWVMAAIAAWLLGAALIAFSLWRGHRYVRQLASSGTPVADPRMLLAARSIQAALHIRRDVTLRYSDHAIPMVCGHRHPVILLPHATVHWTPEQMHDVLTHELAHVQRRDAVTQMLVSLTSILYWFNPLAWIVAREIREQRERACDDLVLTLGRTPSAYATHLLEFARTVRSSRSLTQAALTFARTRHIQHRLRAIVAPNLQREPISQKMCLAAGASALIVTVPLAALTPARLPASPSSPVVSATLHTPPNANLEDLSMKPSAAIMTAALAGTLAASPSMTQPAVAQQDSGARVRIRGDSMTSTGHPLVYVDRVQIDPAQLDSIDPRKIKSIDVTKGPAALAQFGSAAANGVILITMKDSADSARGTKDTPSGGVTRARAPGKVASPVTIITQEDLERRGVTKLDQLFGKDSGRVIRRDTAGQAKLLSDLLASRHPGVVGSDGGQVARLNSVTDSQTRRVGAPAPAVNARFNVEQTATPNIMYSGRPAYPREALEKGISGTVRVSFVVDTTGRVLPKTVRVISSPHALLTKAVIDALPTLVFFPARVDGRPVAQRVSYPFSFTALSQSDSLQE